MGAPAASGTRMRTVASIQIGRTRVMVGCSATWNQRRTRCGVTRRRVGVCDDLELDECDEKRQCKWSTADEVCKTRCRRIKEESDCDLELRCVWSEEEGCKKRQR